MGHVPLHNMMHERAFCSRLFDNPARELIEKGHFASAAVRMIWSCSLGVFARCWSIYPSPPEGKPQPTLAQIVALQWWIDSEAPADKTGLAALSPARNFSTYRRVSDMHFHCDCTVNESAPDQVPNPSGPQPRTYH